MLNNQEAQELGMAISTLVKERGLGAISKKDYELLVFHHLSNAVDLKSYGNYDLANTLKVTESRIKSLRLESSIRHAPANHIAVLGQIVERILTEINKPEFDGVEVSITLENPVEKREFEHAVKSAKHSVEYGINREILKIKLLALFEIIFANVQSPEERFKEVIKSNIKTKSRQKVILNETLPLREKINLLGQDISKNSGAVALLTAAAGMLCI
jgi:hypothetical protein